MNIKTEIRTVTPEWAKQMLDELDKQVAAGQFRQRGVAVRRVERYAADMTAGNWGLNGESICIDENGHLLNGQHRLHAVCKAGVSVKMIVVYNVPEMINTKLRTIDTVDTGYARSASCQLRIDGHTYGNIMAATAKLTALLAHGGGLQKHAFTLSNPQTILIAKLLEGNIVNTAKPLDSRAKHLLRSYIVTPLALLRCFDTDTADLFTTDLIEMANLKKGDPVLALNRYLNRPYRPKGSNSYQMECVYAVSSAICLYASGKKIDYIRGNQDHLDWLLKGAKQVITRVRDIIGADTTLAGLESK